MKTHQNHRYKTFPRRNCVQNLAQLKICTLLAYKTLAYHKTNKKQHF